MRGGGLCENGTPVFLVFLNQTIIKTKETDLETIS